jgi:hypothetical protein
VGTSSAAQGGPWPPDHVRRCRWRRCTAVCWPARQEGGRRGTGTASETQGGSRAGSLGLAGLQRGVAKRNGVRRRSTRLGGAHAWFWRGEAARLAQEVRNIKANTAAGSILPEDERWRWCAPADGGSTRQQEEEEKERRPALGFL